MINQTFCLVSLIRASYGRGPRPILTDLTAELVSLLIEILSYLRMRGGLLYEFSQILSFVELLRVFIQHRIQSKQQHLVQKLQIKSSYVFISTVHANLILTEAHVLRNSSQQQQRELRVTLKET